MTRAPYGLRELIAPSLALFGSLSTLLCCALPALLVSLGLGAALAGLVSAAPQIVWISANKPIVFAVSGVLILASAIVHWRARNAPCPTDPKAAAACQRMRALSTGLLWVSGAAWLIGAFFAFFAAELFF